VTPVQVNLFCRNKAPRRPARALLCNSHQLRALEISMCGDIEQLCRSSTCSLRSVTMVSFSNRTMLSWILQLSFPIALTSLVFVYSQRQHTESKSMWAQLHHSLADLGKQHHWQDLEFSVSMAFIACICNMLSVQLCSFILHANVPAWFIDMPQSSVLTPHSQRFATTRPSCLISA